MFSAANETVLFDFAVEGVNGAPDGMTRDVNGNLWIATYDGQTVSNYCQLKYLVLDTIHVI